MNLKMFPLPQIFGKGLVLILLEEHIDQMDLQIYRVFYPTTTENRFFSRACGTFSRVDDILVHKIICKKFKTLIPSINKNNKK